jgi:hypothetical protein
VLSENVQASLVGDERLQKRRAHAHPIALPCERPDVVAEHPERPRPFLLEDDRRRSRSPFAGAEQLVRRRRRRNEERRSRTPDDAALGRFRRRKEETLGNVAQTDLRSRRPGDVILPSERKNGARDDVSVLVYCKRNDRLAVQRRLVAIVRAVTVIVVELEGDADQRSDRI